MATSNELMAESLEVLNKLQKKNETLVLHGTNQISRVHLERLLKGGWLKEVMKGWYIVSHPGSEGDTTVWYAAFWHFIVKYCSESFGDEWCLNPEFSLDIYSGKTTTPKQLIIKSPKASNNVSNLLYGISLLCLKSEIPSETVKEKRYGLNLYSLEEALIYSSPSYYRNDKISVKVCLSMIKDTEKILKCLADNGASKRAGRLAGAFKNIGNTAAADAIIQTMKTLGHDVREENPFDDQYVEPIKQYESPYAARISMMWNDMRSFVIEIFGNSTKKVIDIEECMAKIDEKYVEDAYHSLSIEGYKISNDLIEKIKSGQWEPDGDDQEQKNALVARGYYLAFQSVKETIVKIINGENAGVAVKKDHSKWYMQMWSPFASVGLLKPSDLIGYRSSQVFIKGSLHTPLSPEAVREAMPVLFELIENEDDAVVRAVLGHFFLGYIHPYMDGNGRMSRFLMNVMLVTAGYDWVIIPSGQRQKYMQSLEAASVDGDITAFAEFLKEIMGAKGL